MLLLHFRCHRHLLFGVFFILFSLTIIAQSALAQSWVNYKDEDGIFYAVIPDNYKINKKRLRVDESTVLTTTETTATIDNTDFIDILKRYAIKYDQTFAHSIPQEDLPDLIEKDLNKYIRYYQSIGGAVREKDIGGFNGQPGGEIVMAYRDDDEKLLSTRIRILYSDTTRLEQIYTGPEDMMFDHRAKTFFDSLRLKDGRTLFEGDANQDWKTTTSPFELFTIDAPGKAPPYVPNDIEITHNNKVERLSLKIYDPVYDNILFYNVYGYRFNTIMNMEHVQLALMKKHLKKFRVDMRQLKFSQSSKNAHPVLGTTMHFTPPKAYPYMNTIKLNAYYHGPYLVVQEMVGRNAHVESVLARRMLKLINFTPAEAHKKYTAEKRGQAQE